MKRRVRGQSMVELALLLPFFVLITLGTIELGYYIYTYSELENATRRVSEFVSKTPPRTAANDGDTCELLAENEGIEGVTLSRLQRSNIGITLLGDRAPGDQVEVDVQYQGNFLTPVGRSFFGNALSFQFTSRRTIMSTYPPIGFRNDCTPR